MRILALLLALATAPAWGADWFVCPDSVNTPTSNGTNYATDCFDGDLDIAWASINPGDTLYLCGDWGPADTRITVEDSGSAGNYVALSGNASKCGRASNSTISRAGLTGINARAIAASNTTATRAYIRIEDLEISDVSAGVLWDYSTSGAVTDDTSLWIRRVKFRNCGTGAGTDGDCVWKRGLGLIVEDSTFDGCWEDCIWYRGKGASIVRNVFRRVSFGGILGDCTQIDLTGVTDSGVVTWSENECDHQVFDVKYGFVIGPTAGAGSSVTVQDNTVLCPLVPTNSTPANQCHPIYFDTATATAITAKRNFTQGGEVGISLTAGAAAAFSTRAIIQANIVYKASDRGIWTDANVDNIDIWNNIVSEAGQEALYIGKSGAALNANNNILVNSASGLFYVTAPTSRGYNAYFGNATNVDVNGTPGATTTGDSTSAPGFIGGNRPTAADRFRFGPGSTLACAGQYVGFHTDHAGRGFEPNCTPIGAFVYGAGDARGAALPLVQ